MTRAVITGLGCIAPIRQSVEEFWRNLTVGVSGAASITAFGASDDAAETAIMCAPRDRAYKVAITAPKKSMVGHQFGAGGAVSSLAPVLALRDGIVPPTINLETPDPECDLDYTSLEARELTVQVALANGFGLAGRMAS